MSLEFITPRPGVSARPLDGAGSFHSLGISHEVTILLAFICCFFLSSLYLKRYYHIYQLRNRQEELTHIQRNFESENRLLREKVNELSTLEGVEYLARTKLGMVKAGEKVVRPVRKQELDELNRQIKKWESR